MVVTFGETNQNSLNSKSSLRNSERLHTFRVLVKQHLEPSERIAVIGECSSLGRWLPAQCVLLKRENDESNEWTNEVYIPANELVPYRYFICSIDPETRNIHVRRWETHLCPRKVLIEHDADGTFGDVNGVVKIDRGWLTTETLFQFKFIRNPFILEQNLINRQIFVKLTPMKLRINTTQLTNPNEPVYAFTEVLTLKSATNDFESQPKFGKLYQFDDIMIFNVIVGDPDNVAYRLDLFAHNSRTTTDDDEPSLHLGYHFISPNIIREELGKVEMPITSASTHQLLGMMRMEYFRANPLNSSVELTMERTYIRHWDQKHKCLEVGHRGSGPSFKPTTVDDEIRENTIASLRRAIDAGADMVEFDVQLSKDLVPVVYHDLVVSLSLRKKKSSDEYDYLEIPMNELTLEQLKHLKVYHSVEGESKKARFNDEHLDDHQPFPQLADLFDALDVNAGFNIEIKWNMEFHDGTHVIERANNTPNLYLDRILDVVLNKAGSRRIVFSCFNADICIMLRWKQNRFPVMFLSRGLHEEYKRFHDPRGDTVANAVFHAHSQELLGIVPRTRIFLHDPEQLNLAAEFGLICFFWGDEINSKEVIKFLKTLTLHGIIYDNLSKLIEKTSKTLVKFN